ncbi:unnamed protein product [Bursaphelenchus xylophilus]|uniref:(pine wood nematode) hypothetical protein n=1 Tax=Bursaphelenchus xylophilus TaxID=6326 RepID=A0A1I7RXI5_BURXY|nr:unnamed protein product [Bursaphelenchus xylophilus]CAG9126456.1 unnamed protein product [Bursaphelenchus xylophilus]
MFTVKTMMRRRLHWSFGNRTILLVLLEILLFLDIVRWWSGLGRHSESEQEDDAVVTSYVGDDCSIRRTDSMKQKSGRYCNAQCIPWNQTLSLNEDPIPEPSVERFEGICQGLDAKNCVKPFKTIESDFQYYWTLKPKKTLMCTIPKTSSQLMTAIMCLLNDELGFFYSGKEMFGNYYGPACSKHRVKSVEHAVQIHGPEVNEWTKLTVVREPIDRFLSGFVFACVRGVDFATNCTRYCHGCGANLTCFVEKEYEEMMRLSSGEQTTVDFLSHHQYPQTWRCGMDKYLKDYTVLKYSSKPAIFMPRVLEFLHSKNVSEQAMDYIKNVAMKERTHHATSNTNARKFFEHRLKSSPYLMEKVVRMFYHDFKTFGYPLPPGFE